MEKTANQKTAQVKYFALFVGIVAMAIIAFLPYAVIDYDGNYQNLFGVFNAMLNLDGNDLVTIYRIVSLIAMTMLAATFAIYAILALVFAILNVVKVATTNDYEDGVKYMYENFYSVYTKAVLSLVLCSVLGSSPVAVWSVVAFVILSLIPVAVSVFGTEKIDFMNLCVSLALIVAGVLVIETFRGEFNLNLILNDLNPVLVKVGGVCAILFGIAFSLLFETQKNALEEEKAGMCVTVKSIVALALALLALIFNAVANTVGFAIVCMVIAFVLIALITIKNLLSLKKAN